MNIIQEAYSQLYPEKTFNYNTKIKYSNKFSDFNANVKKHYNNLEFSLSKKWKSVDRDIKLGIIQNLMNKIFKTKVKTNNIDLYNIFIKKLHLSIPKTESNPVLENSFNRINEKYFYGIIEKPNLKWGSSSIRQLGMYNYQTDTITVSTIFKNHMQVLDYIMYHEMLHKKFKFTNKKSRSMHHTSEFKKKEKEFENVQEMERLIKIITAKKRIKKIFWPF